MLNMMDEARAKGIDIDIDALSALLGVSVFPTVATRAIGIDELRRGIDQAEPGPCHPELAALLPGAYESLSRAEKVLLAEADVSTAEKHGLEPGQLRDKLYGWRRHQVNEIVSNVITRTGKGDSWRDRLGYWMMHPLTGIPLLLVMLFATYLVLGEGIAVRVVGFNRRDSGPRRMGAVYTQSGPPSNQRRIYRRGCADRGIRRVDNDRSRIC